MRLDRNYYRQKVSFVEYCFHYKLIFTLQNYMETSISEWDNRKLTRVAAEAARSMSLAANFNSTWVTCVFEEPCVAYNANSVVHGEAKWWSPLRPLPERTSWRSKSRILRL